MAPSANQLASRNARKFKQGTWDRGDHGIDVSRKEHGRNAISETDDVDVEIHLCCSEGLSDENACMWLSSSCMPPSFQSSRNPQSSDTLGNDFWEVLLYYQFSAVPPIFRGDGAVLDVDQKNLVSDESCTNSKEASIRFETMKTCVAEGRNDDLLGDDRIKYSSMGHSEGDEFGYRRSFCEDSSAEDSSWSSLDTCDEPPSPRDYDLDIISIWFPLLDLEGEEPKWDANAFDVLDQDFPGPACHRQMNFQSRSSSLSCGQASKQPLDAQALVESPGSLLNLSPEQVLLDVKSLPKDLDADEPLFWPFDQKSYWSTELEWNYLGISPFGSALNIKRPAGCYASKSVQFRLHHQNNSSLHTKSIQQRNQGSQSHHAGHDPCRDPSSQISRDTGIPSGLARSTRSPSDRAIICSLSKKDGARCRHQSNSLSNKHGVNQKTSLDKYLLEFEADDFQIHLTGEIPIEALVGLDEFDGHEGIGAMTRGCSMEAFNEDQLL